MKTQIGLESRRSLLLAGMLALFSQAALSGEANAARPEPEQITVTAPRAEIAIPKPAIETDAEAVIEAMNRRIAKDLEQSIEAISNARIELAISEFPTRG